MGVWTLQGLNFFFKLHILLPILHWWNKPAEETEHLQETQKRKENSRNILFVWQKKIKLCCPNVGRGFRKNWGGEISLHEGQRNPTLSAKSPLPSSKKLHGTYLSVQPWAPGISSKISTKAVNLASWSLESYKEAGHRGTDWWVTSHDAEPNVATDSPENVHVCLSWCCLTASPSPPGLGAEKNVWKQPSGQHSICSLLRVWWWGMATATEPISELTH